MILRRKKKRKKKHPEDEEEDTRAREEREREVMELYDMKTAEQTAQAYFRMIWKR